MIHNAIKTYLHSSPIGESEINLIKELLKDGGEELKDFLPKEEKQSRWFLSRLLDASLKDYKNNKEFINSILNLKNDNNKDTLYFHLKNNKYGLELIKNNPTLFNDDLNEAFKDLLQNGSSKPILDFVKNHKDKINIENIYGYYLDVSLISSLEKLGTIFDDRIIDVVVNKKNYRKPNKILQYIEKFESTCNEKIWNHAIIRMLRYYNKEIWDDYGKNKIGDSFSLISKIKNPSQYKWGQQIDNRYAFNFDDSLRALLDNRALHGYIENEKPKGIDTVKDFIKNNDIYFTRLKGNELILSAFVDDFSDAVLEKTIKDNWNDLFDFKETQEERRKHRGFYPNRPIFDQLSSENNVVLNNILQNERIRKIILKEYLTNKNFRLEHYHEGSFFTTLGLSENEIIDNNAFSKYSHFLTKEDAEYVCKALNLKGKKFEMAILNYEMEISMPTSLSTVQKKKVKV